MTTYTPSKYVLGIDSAVLAFSVLKSLGAGDVTTFSQRLKSQKMQYLAQVFGVSPAYDFSLYIHGPYSPTFAKDLFTLHTDKQVPGSVEFVPDELKERYKLLSTFVTDKTNRQLELITTAHLFKKGLSYPEKTIIERLQEWKKASSVEITECLKELNQIP